MDAMDEARMKGMEELERRIAAAPARAALSAAQRDLLKKAAAEREGRVPMRYVQTRTLEVLAQQGLIEYRLTAGMEDQMGTRDAAVQAAKFALQDEDPEGWRKALRYLKEADDAQDRINAIIRFEENVARYGANFQRVALQYSSYNFGGVAAWLITEAGRKAAGA